MRVPPGPLPAGMPRWVLPAIGVYVAALIVAGLLLHPIAAIGVENDDFVGKASELLAGRLPVDPYRPLGYPLAVAGIGWMVGDCFAGARIVSALGAGMLLAATFALADRCGGRRLATLAVVLVGANGWVMTHGMTASSDMLFTGFTVVALAIAVRAYDHPGRREFVALGVFLALAWFTRYQALTLLLPAAIACCTPAGGASGRGMARVRRLALVAATAVVCLIPHFLLTNAVFGSLVHDENWRSVELKYEHGMIFSRLPLATRGSVLAVLAHDPTAVLARTLQDLHTLYSSALPELMQGSQPSTVGGTGLAMLAAAGILHLLVRRGSLLWLPVAHQLAAAVALCLLFVPLPRLLLANVAMLGLGLATVVLAIPGGRLAYVRGATAAAALAFTGWHAVVAVESLCRAHPWPEVVAARGLRDEAMVPFRLLTSYGFLASQLLPDQCVLMPPPQRGEDLDAYAERLVRAAERWNAAYVLYGRRSCGDEMFTELLELEHPRVRVQQRTDEVLLLQVAGIELDWIAHARVVPRPAPARELDVEVVLRDHVDLRDVVAVGVSLRGVGGERGLVVLAGAGERTWRGAVVAPPEAGGEGAPADALTLMPVVLGATGRFGRGDVLLVGRR